MTTPIPQPVKEARRRAAAEQRALAELDLAIRYCQGAAVRDLGSYSVVRKALDRQLGPVARRAIARQREEDARLRGYVTRGVKDWSRSELAAMRREYHTTRAAALAGRFGCTECQVHVCARRLGLARHYRGNRRAQLEALLRRRHAQGWTDTEIAAEFGCNRRTLCDMRKRLGIPHNAYSQRQRLRVAAKTREQLARIGLTTLGQLRPWAHRQRAIRAGWPADLKWRQVQILDLLWTNGPMTRDQIGAALGLRKKPHGGRDRRIRSLLWYPMHCNTPGHRCDTSYMANLLKRGLIVNLGRVVRNKPPGARNGQGRNTCMYSLALWVERKPPQ